MKCKLYLIIFSCIFSQTLSLYTLPRHPLLPFKDLIDKINPRYKMIGSGIRSSVLTPQDEDLSNISNDILYRDKIKRIIEEEIVLPEWIKEHEFLLNKIR
uniref:Uncharacterized protein n=1 Tax=Strongyloides venezuelensis TaxID=75913 RepID=A0A0K0FFK3_STRVS